MIEIERISSPLDRVLDRLHGRIEALHVADHQGHARTLRRSDDRAAFLDIGGDRLLDQHMHAALDAGERDVVVQVGRRRDNGGIDAEIEQFLGIVANCAADDLGQQRAMRCARVGDADDLHARKIGEHTGMIAAHDPDTDDAEPNRRVLRGITHVIVHPPPRPREAL